MMEERMLRLLSSVCSKYAKKSEGKEEVRERDSPF